MYERAITVAPNGKFADEAAYACVISTKNAVRTTDQTSGKPPCPDKKPCAIPSDVQRLAAAFDRYLAVVPASEDRPTMEYRRARIWYDYQHFAEGGADCSITSSPAIPTTSSRPTRRISRWTAWPS